MNIPVLLVALASLFVGISALLFLQSYIHRAEQRRKRRFHYRDYH